MASRSTAFTDGGSRGNPGPASCAWVLYENGTEIARQGGYLGIKTNNVAEYNALVSLLEYCDKAGYGGVQVSSDSELMVKHLTGIYTCKSPDLRPLFEKADGLMGLTRATITHIRREFNKVADAICNDMLDIQRDQKLDVNVPFSKTEEVILK
jgi:ribonuclease HI